VLTTAGLLGVGGITLLRTTLVVVLVVVVLILVTLLTPVVIVAVLLIVGALLLAIIVTSAGLLAIDRVDRETWQHALFVIISIAMLALLLVLSAMGAVGVMGVVVVLAILVVVVVGVLALLALSVALSLAVAVVVLASLRMSGHRGKLLEWDVESQTMGIRSGRVEWLVVRLPQDTVDGGCTWVRVLLNECVVTKDRAVARC
jgi:xanthine/uracil permease